jgi:NhaA family Na+:H+ antiporter
MSQIFGVSFLGGIGFTMSIFVADLAFSGNPDFIFQAKIGILTASLFAGNTKYLTHATALGQDGYFKFNGRPCNVM